MVRSPHVTLSDACSDPCDLSSIAKSSRGDICETSDRLSDRYRLLNLIGQGGFGRTFLAIDETHPSQSRCVIKQFFLHEHDTRQRKSAVEQFCQEALQLAELGKHSQIPQLLDYFELDGQFYLVQEWIDGQNLEQELAEVGGFTETEIWYLLNELLPILQFIHAHGVIHRDIKPANIIRRCNNQFVLVDFGAAKSVTSTNLDQTGTIIGSAEYAAPEQMRGKAVFTSDLYSLGLTCLHLLTQLSPFDLFDCSEDAWAWREYLNEPVSASLGHLLDKLLLPAIKRRYQSATEVLKDLCFYEPVVSPSEKPPLQATDVSQSFLNRYEFSVTVFDPSTQSWYHTPASESSNPIGKPPKCLSPRLAAAAAAPPVRGRDVTKAEKHLHGVWWVLGAIATTAIAAATIICITLAIEPNLPATALKGQQSGAFQESHSLGQQ